MLLLFEAWYCCNRHNQTSLSFLKSENTAKTWQRTSKRSAPPSSFANAKTFCQRFTQSGYFICSSDYSRLPKRNGGGGRSPVASRYSTLFIDKWGRSSSQARYTNGATQNSSGISGQLSVTKDELCHSTCLFNMKADKQVRSAILSYKIYFNKNK